MVCTVRNKRNWPVRDYVKAQGFYRTDKGMLGWDGMGWSNGKLGKIGKG